jgi:hypothetical protein
MSDMNVKEKKEHLAKLRESMTLFSTEEARLARELGEPSVTNYAEAHRQEDEGALMFDRLTPAEKVDLYTNNHAEWKRILDAKEAAGARKLMKWR